MSLRVIADQGEISRCQTKLVSRLRKAGEPRKGKCGYLGGHIDADMVWFPEEKFWWAYQRIPDGPEPRHWNAFGLEEPLGDSRMHDIACEINFPLFAGTWRVAGALAMDESGEVYVVHSGRIGGGRKGVGRSLFMENFAGSRQWSDAERNGKPKKVVVVSALDDDELVQNLAHFAREVGRIKKLTGGTKPPPAPPSAYRREFSGYRKPYSTKGEIRAGVEHGRIVHSLHDLATAMGIQAWNNQPTDLLLRRKTTAMLEVKTGDYPYSRYTAIGQLLYHSKSDDDVLVAVFPSIDGGFRRILGRLGIVGVTWHRSGSAYGFGRELHETLGQL